MALKLAVFALASCLLVTARVSSFNDEYVFMEVAQVGNPVTKPPPVVPPAPAPALPGPQIVKTWRECPGVCKDRCKLHSRQNVCNRACTTCCSVCKCVPPGTAGNREMCGKCYTEWKTHGNRTKCP
ncbi:hypothetical protein J5N97_005058 [Dioscorea zingiberensis]|uniref:Uncharacterized protein n=1 Tax=Dioscorea zingiberensis TaxID=325984 RepID=A0A9D5HSQ8_9LILI|nr:hypothetical protein J5N97_005058 [Dioscorea zingiberensis]